MPTITPSIGLREACIHIFKSNRRSLPGKALAANYNITLPIVILHATENGIWKILVFCSQFSNVTDIDFIEISIAIRVSFWGWMQPQRLIDFAKMRRIIFQRHKNNIVLSEKKSASRAS
jgi:hypothetical protein